MNTDVLSRPKNAVFPEMPNARPPVAIIGLGYVGLPLAIQAQQRGYTIRGFDIDAHKIEDIRKGSPSYLSDEENEALQKKRIPVSDDESILNDASTFVICVPTPVHEDGEPDLAPLIGASEVVARHLKRGDMVIVESTVSPGVCEKISLSILENMSGLKGERDFAFAHCPERINPGDEKWDVRTIPRVLGGLGPKSLARAKEFYEGVIEGSIHPMGSIAEAEAVKMVENAFRDVNIAFVNELAMSFAKAGIDITNVLEGAGTKPFGFVRYTPGCGVGGHCIPVDPYYLIRYGRENGFEHRFLVAAREINSTMPHYTVDMLEEALKEQGKSLSGTTVALLGLAYKADVPDMRESPATEIREELERRGAHVLAYDPLVPEHSSAESLEETLEKSDAAILATAHQQFCDLGPAQFIARGVRTVIDGRNCLSKDDFIRAGIVYRGIGR